MYYILEDKTPRRVFDVIEWAKQKDINKVVGNDMVNGCRVSTVFLGMDHGFMESTPVLFETMIFGGEHDLYCERYNTWNEAEKGHQRAIELVKSTV